MNIGGISLGAFGDSGGDVLGSIMNGALGLGIFLIIVGVIGGAFFYIHWRLKFNIVAEIYSERSNSLDNKDKKRKISANHKLVFDRAAILYDKKNQVWFLQLLNEKMRLPEPPFNALQSSNKGNVIKIWQKSNTEYVYLLPDQINAETVVLSNGEEVPSGKSMMKQVEGDVSYWNQLKKRDVKKMFDTEHWAAKLLPYIIPTLMFMLVIFLTWMVLDKFEVMRGMASTMNQAATALENAAKLLANQQSVQVVTG